MPSTMATTRSRIRDRLSARGPRACAGGPVRYQWRTLPAEINKITKAVIASAFRVTGLAFTPMTIRNAVAASLVADAGARQIQGTLNGLGERCGNANLTTLIPTLLLKDPYASQFEIDHERLKR